MREDIANEEDLARLQEKKAQLLAAAEEGDTQKIDGAAENLVAATRKVFPVKGKARLRENLEILVVALAVLLLAALGRYLWLAGPAGAGLAAKQLCSLVLHAGLAPDRARSLYVDRAVFPLSLWLTADYGSEQVEVTGWGLFTARASVRQGLGCTLTTGAARAPAPVALPAVPATNPHLPVTMMAERLVARW